MSQPRHSAVLTHYFLDLTRLISNSFADVRQTLLAMGLAALCMAQAHAARPMNTDDANIVDEKSCQLETWAKTTRTSLERWAMPGCNLGGEFWVGQVKKRWVPVGENSVGISTTVGTMATRPATADRPNDKDYYLNVPVTVPLGHERFVHLNAGWVQHQSLGVSRATWGVGGELPLSPMVIAIAETYGEQNTGRARYQVGLRVWVVPKHVQIDTTYGNQLGQPEHLRWFTVGLRLLSPAFLP
jgi:hypothetical protein